MAMLRARVNMRRRGRRLCCMRCLHGRRNGPRLCCMRCLHGRMRCHRRCCMRCLHGRTQLLHAPGVRHGVCPDALPPPWPHLRCCARRCSLRTANRVAPQRQASFKQRVYMSEKMLSPRWRSQLVYPDMQNVERLQALAAAPSLTCKRARLTQLSCNQIAFLQACASAFATTYTWLHVFIDMQWHKQACASGSITLTRA